MYLKEVMVRGAQTIRRLTEWGNRIDAITTMTYVMNEHGEAQP